MHLPSLAILLATALDHGAMSTSLFELPQRHSLAAQAAAAMRKAIEEGEWQDYVPSERRLSELFQISRPTVRTALHLLAKEGLLEIRQGRRNRLCGGVKSATVPRSRLVLLVTSEQLGHMSLAISQSISEMKLHLAEHGFITEMMVCPDRGSGAQRRKLALFVQQNRVFCCVLLSVSVELQKWFYGRSIPAMVFGSCHPEVRLPHLDIDYRSVCRHATGVLLGKGHRRIALVVPHSEVAGYLVSEQGFNEAVAQHRERGDEVVATIVRHNGTAQNIGTKLDAAFRSDRAPTALLVAKPLYVQFVIVYLLTRGLAMPGQVSLISRDYDRLFETVSPTISHYSLPHDTFAHRLSRLMVQMVTQGFLPAEPNLIQPKYFPGETVKTLN